MVGILREIKRKLSRWILHKRRLLELLANQDLHLTETEIVSGIPQGVSRVLVISPHPDDESLGCGGTLSLLSRAGVEIDIVFMTSGASPGDVKTAAVREEEARAAANLLGAGEVFFLRGQQDELYRHPELSFPLAAILAKQPYDIVFCPWVRDLHSDHIATFQIFKAAVKSSSIKASVWLYEIWSPLPANRIVNIDSTIENKKQAIGAHQSQLVAVDYTGKFVSLASYRSMACPTAKYAEAFLTCQTEFLVKAF